MKHKVLVTMLLIVSAFTFAGCTILDKIKNPIATLTGKSTNGGTSTSITDQISGKFEDLINLGKSVSCSFSTDKDDVKQSVKVFVSGNKMRTDSTSKIGDADEQTFHMVSDGTYAYIWSTESDKGMRMNYADMQKDENGNPQQNPLSGNVILEQIKQYDYKCVPWIPDSSKFTTPANIEFQDLSELMNSIKQMGVDSVPADDTSGSEE
jgi:hypothetical protein